MSDHQNQGTACSANRAQLTPSRESVLEILSTSSAPMSAYDILDLYQKKHASGAQPPTIYRALSFLENKGFIHRVASTRKYLTCDHLGHHSDQTFTLFFICDQCGSAQETLISQSFLSEVNAQATQIGFTLNQPSLEIQGTCEKCAES